MHFISYRDMADHVGALVPECISMGVSSIYGIPRSGMIPATILSQRLHLPLAQVGSVPTGGDRLKDKPVDGKVLLVDDSVYRGGAMREAIRDMIRHGIPRNRIVRACVYLSPGSEKEVDIYAQHLPGPRFFEWNFMNCAGTPKMMFDMDGVLCPDPLAFDDDGLLYENDIRTLPPKLIPSVPIGWVTTNRLERWREITQAWLNRYGIVINHGLNMQAFKTADERRRANNKAPWKAEIYAKARRDHGCILFVESHDHHAKPIAEISGLPVLSVQSMKLFT